MRWQDNAMVQPARDAFRALRLRMERLLTPGLRRDVETLLLRQEILLARLDDMARVMRRTSLDVSVLEAALRRASATTRQGGPSEAWHAALRGLGVMNYENTVVSGERIFLERYLARQSAAVILDIGANTGQFAALCREIGPAAVIHSVEPHPRAHAVLAGRAAELRIVAHRLAISDSEGEVAFYDYADEAGSQHASLYREVIEGVHRRPATEIRVTCTTLDSFLSGLGLDHVGLLKIDTEGHELAALRGARALLARGAIETIQFEFNEMNVVSRVFMKDFFDILPNYRLFRLLPFGAVELERYDPCSMEIFAFQNIVAQRRDLDHAWITATEAS